MRSQARHVNSESGVELLVRNRFVLV
jgi:hypothetical protein